MNVDPQTPPTPLVGVGRNVIFRTRGDAHGPVVYNFRLLRTESINSTRHRNFRRFAQVLTRSSVIRNDEGSWRKQR
jgi:hypothetical protein